MVFAASSDDLDQLESLGDSVDGAIMQDASPEVLCQSLRLIVTGERVLPTALLSRLFLRQIDSVHTVERYEPGHGLSKRELQILQKLVLGSSNKEIGRGLQITEATVKVHLRTILRKIQVSNRTQAAIWAINAGLAPKPVAPAISQPVPPPSQRDPLDLLPLASGHALREERSDRVGFIACNGADYLEAGVVGS